MLNKQFGKYLWVPAVLIICASWWSYNRFSANPKSYIGVTTFYVGNSGSLNSTAEKPYNYDQYYNITSSSTFADSLVNIFSSPNTVSQIYQKANLPLPSGDSDQLTRIIKSQKVSVNSQAIIVSIKTNNKNNTQILTNSLPQVIKENLDNLKKTGIIPQEIVVTSSEPIILENENNILISMGAPIIAALIFGLTLVYILNNTRSSNSS